jgi:xanthine dehydrogenase accessory factor
MRLEMLQAINAERAARRACALVTDQASGEQRFLREQDLARLPWMTDPLQNALQDAFRTGKSGLVEQDGRAVFITVHAPPVRLVVTGAVHISQALIPMARALNIDVTVIDPREAFATPERFPGVALLAEWPDAALQQVPLDSYTAFIALTHDPKIDDPALFAALRSSCFYIGALGSRRTHAKRLERLAAAGFAEADFARIHAPIGLNIGAVSPAEIALSIMAEIVATLRAERVAAKAGTRENAA